MLSSPWPDRIEIQSIKKLPEQGYEVRGEIIEITSEEKVKGGFAAKQPITLVDGAKPAPGYPDHDLYASAMGPASAREIQRWRRAGPTERAWPKQ